MTEFLATVSKVRRDQTPHITDNGEECKYLKMIIQSIKSYKKPVDSLNIFVLKLLEAQYKAFRILFITFKILKYNFGLTFS